MSDDGFFPKIYRRFLDRRNQVQGHDFEEVPIISEVPPIVTFKDKLRWWSFDRWKRIRKIREERDRRLHDIVQVKPRPNKH